MLAREIAGTDANAEIQELARRVAEAEIDLRRVRYARHQLLFHALSDPYYDSRENDRKKLAFICSLARPNAPDIPVCTENLIRIDCVTESPNVNGDDRALLPLPDPVRLAVQVEEPRSMTISAGSIQLPPCSTALLLLDVEGCERILLGVAHPDLLQRPLAFRLLALRQLVQHIGPSTS